MTGFAGADRNYFYGGGPPPQSEREINTQFEPGTLINLAAAGIMKERDTIDAQILTGMPYGRNPTQANKPTLEFPMSTLRMLKGSFEGTDKNYENQLNKLLNLLPEEMKNRLSQEMQMRPGQRDPVYTSLQKTLSFIAMAMVWASARGLAEEPSTIDSRFAAKNLALTEKALQNLISQGEDILKSGYAYLKKVGSNHPNFDELLKILNEASHALKLLKRLSDENSRHKKKQQHEELDEEKEHLKAMEEAILQILERTARHTRNGRKSSELQIVGSALKAMALISKTKTVNGGMRSLFFGSIIAVIGIDTGTSKAGLIGPSTKRFIDTIAATLGETYLKDYGPAAKRLLPDLIETVLAIALCASLFTLKKDLHKDVEHDLFDETDLHLSEKNQIATNTYTLWNLIVLILNIDVMKHFVPENLNDTPYGISKEINVIKQMIELVTILFIAKLIGFCDEEAKTTLLLGLSPHILPRLEVLEEALNTTKETTFKTPGITKAQIEQAVQHVASCRIGLKNNDIANFNKYFDQLVGAFNPSVTDFDNEIADLYRLLKQVIEHLTTDITDHSIPETGISQI